jgi:hypothetical protein
MQRIAAMTVLGVVGLTAGCRVDEHKNGNSENVKIDTPFGGMSVKTNDSAATADTGLDVYPGAQLVKKDGKDGDDGAADVNMSFGPFRLRVKAGTYRTPDAPAKVLAFYKAGLTKYGVVIQCANNEPVGTPERTAEGLTCDNDKENHITISKNVTGKMELKTGSNQHQHIVAIDPEGTGTKIGLVALDLPGHISMDSDSDSNKGERKQ